MAISTNESDGNSPVDDVVRSQVSSGRPAKPTWDEYYLGLAATISWRSACSGAPVGALIIRNNRILTTGYNGTPEGWPNCDTENGCPRCYARAMDEQLPGAPGRPPPPDQDRIIWEKKNDKETAKARDDAHAEAGVNSSQRERPESEALDECVCVHAEANALITAARFGIAVDGAEVYTTDMPCMQCAKDLLQAGISRVLYMRYFKVASDETVVGQLVRGTHHQLMRDLRARKYRLTNTAVELGGWMSWLADHEKRGLEVPRPRTALDDDQYSDKGRALFASWEDGASATS